VEEIGEIEGEIVVVLGNSVDELAEGGLVEIEYPVGGGDSGLSADGVAVLGTNAVGRIVGADTGGGGRGGMGLNVIGRTFGTSSRSFVRKVVSRTNSVVMYFETEPDSNAD